MSNIGKLEEKISSGKNINRPSDNPIQTSRILELDNRVNFNSQYQENVDEGITFLTFTETSLNDSLTVMNEIYKISLQGSDVSVDSYERETMSRQVDQLLQEMINISNKKYQDKYVFGGTRTLESPFQAYTTIEDEVIANNGDNQAIQLSRDSIRKLSGVQIRDMDGNALIKGQDFEVDYDKATITFLADGNAQVESYQVTYKTFDVKFDEEVIEGVDANERGINGHFYQEIEEDIKVSMNITGYEAYQEQIDVFDTIIQLRKSLEDNDQYAVNATIEDIQSSIKQLNQVAGLTGTKLQRLNLASGRLKKDNLTFEEFKSNIQDLDAVKAAMDLQALRNVYQSAIYSARVMFETTLSNFL